MIRAVQPGNDPLARNRSLVLIVDDCDDTRALYAEYLELEGFDVKEARDGPSAIDAALSARPDVVVMDLGLPGMGGAETAARLKADARTSAIPVIVVSGYSPDLLADTGRPWDEFVVKPCEPAALLSAIARWLPRA